MVKEINRDNWLNTKIIDEKIPMWPCPTCGEGQLRIPNPWFYRKPNASTQVQTHVFLKQFPEYNDMHFTGFLKCSNMNCGENVSLLGKASIDTIYDWDVDGERNRDVFEPCFFYPYLCIFPISRHCPENISEQIKLSFSHYFNDISASANALRTALEILLDHQKIKKTTITNKGKREKLNLHSRIDIFGKENSSLKSFLIAAKWIGNAGSHQGGLVREDILDGMELLQHCIDDLYDKPMRLKELTKKAKTINHKRKPIQGK